ncbi:MAG: serine/threonine protein kinase [Deltaproteobacteria bacterium]|nr:serine/threonine protein kinase [Deltaproteobacteria bacterium]
MPKSAKKTLTSESLLDEVRFLLKTLLRDDLFGEEVSLTEAEKLLENSLSVGFVEYCTFLKKYGYVDIRRENNTIKVREKGRATTIGSPDEKLILAVSEHFASRLEAKAAASTPGAAAKTPLTEAIISERYVRYEAIGQGTLGTVYRAKNAVLGRDVAFKEMAHVFDYVTYLSKEELTARIKDASLKQAQLEHPHILSVVDLDFSGRVPYVILGYASGGSLKERMFRASGQTSGVLDVNLSIRILMQASYALQHAHRQGVTHGNLKPDNVLFDRAGNVLLSDFGVAKVTQANKGTGIVYVGTGSPSYMAPEQLHSQDVGPAADIYALGILFYQLLTGDLPGRRSPMPSEQNKDVPKGLDDIFDKMTCDRLDERYTSFDEVLEDLYKTLPAEEVLARGSLILFEEDPFPPVDLEDTGSPEDDATIGAKEASDVAAQQKSEAKKPDDSEKGTLAKEEKGSKKKTNTGKAA